MQRIDYEELAKRTADAWRAQAGRPDASDPVIRYQIEAADLQGQLMAFFTRVAVEVEADIVAGRLPPGDDGKPVTAEEYATIPAEVLSSILGNAAMGLLSGTISNGDIANAIHGAHIIVNSFHRQFSAMLKLALNEAQPGEGNEDAVYGGAIKVPRKEVPN